MTEHLDVVVIGAGVMGAAAAWQLADRGREVTVLERTEPAHAGGASHGEVRNLNFAYTEPEYQAMLSESVRLWDELEERSGQTLLSRHGLVDHGDDPRHDLVLEALLANGIEAGFLRLDEASERWPGIRFEGRVLHMPGAGTIRAEDSVRAMLGLGARLRTAEVLAISLADDGVRLEVDGDRIVARSAVVTAGAWTGRLLGALLPLPRLTVTQEQPAAFAPWDAGTPWPSFNHRKAAVHDDWPATVYGMPSPGEGVKAGWHGTGPVVDPDRRSFEPEPAQRAALQRYARDWLPGVDPEELVDISCTYTTTPDTDFVLDSSGPLVVAAGFSGHGFKFAPAVGRIVADLADGIPAPARFRGARLGSAR